MLPACQCQHRRLRADVRLLMMITPACDIISSLLSQLSKPAGIQQHSVTAQSLLGAAHWPVLTCCLCSVPSQAPPNCKRSMGALAAFKPTCADALPPVIGTTCIAGSFTTTLAAHSAFAAAAAAACCCSQPSPPRCTVCQKAGSRVKRPVGDGRTSASKVLLQEPASSR
jgi:hypothetical protein